LDSHKANFATSIPLKNRALTVFFLSVLFVAAVVFYFYGNEVLGFLTPSSLKIFILKFGWLAPVVFTLISFTLTLLFVSTTLFTISSGLLFGKVWGSVLVICSATLAAQVAFEISRRLGRKHVVAIKKKKGIGAMFDLVEEKCSTDGLRNMIILRCLLLPYIALSYSAGMVRTLSAKDHFLATFLTNCLVTPAFVVLGDSLLAGPKALVLPVIVISIMLLAPRILKRFID